MHEKRPARYESPFLRRFSAIGKTYKVSSGNVYKTTNCNTPNFTINTALARVTCYASKSYFHFVTPRVLQRNKKSIGVFKYIPYILYFVSCILLVQNLALREMRNLKENLLLKLCRLLLLSSRPSDQFFFQL